MKGLGCSYCFGNWLMRLVVVWGLVLLVANFCVKDIQSVANDCVNFWKTASVQLHGSSTSSSGATHVPVCHSYSVKDRQPTAKT